MMYHMTKKNIDQLLDVLALDLIVDVHHGGQQVPEVPKSILIRFPFKKQVEMMYHMTKKNIDQLPDVLALDLIVDVHHGDQIRKNRFFYERYTQDWVLAVQQTKNQPSISPGSTI